MTARDRRRIRYGAAVGAVLAGALCAAALTNSVGNTVATVLIGVGLLAFVIMLLRDMGLLDTGGASAPAPPAQPTSNGDDPHRADGPDQGPLNASAPRPGARRGVNVPRPDRMRGQRRRLR